MKQTRWSKKSTAFTLIELLVVIAIIGILVTVAVIALQSARAKARDAKRIGNVKQVQTALELFFNDKGRYPTAAEWGTGSIFSTSTNGTTSYMVMIPESPSPADGPCSVTDNAYVYTPTPDGVSYTIKYCLGGPTGSLISGGHCASPAGIDTPGNCGWALPNGFGDEPSSTSFAQTLIDDSPSADYYFNLGSDADYLYALGYMYDLNDGFEYAVITKYNKNDLTVAARQILADNPGSQNEFYSVVVETDYIYLIGTSFSGVNSQDGLVVKCNKSDLSIVSQKNYGDSELQYFYGGAIDSNYLYVVGTHYGSNYYGGVLIKYNKNDLSVVSSTLLDEAGNQNFYAVAVDSNYVYVAGSENTGDVQALIVKYDKNDLSLLAQKSYGNSGGEDFHALALDGGNVYVAGYSSSNLSREAALLVKFDSNLNVIDSKIHGSDGANNRFQNLIIDGSNLYAAGYSFELGSSGSGLLAQYNKDTLGFVAGKYFDGIAGRTESFEGVAVDSNNIYAAGYSNTGTIASNNNGLFVTKVSKELTTGNYISTPSNFVCGDSNLGNADVLLNNNDLFLTPSVPSFPAQDANLNSSSFNFTPTYYDFSPYSGDIGGGAG